MNPIFLDLEDILSLHQAQLHRYGGSDGVRDEGLLRSALAMPRMTFGGAYLHDDPFFMAAAYLYHITMNHAFVDGNKRTGLLAALVFLDLNGYPIDREDSSLYSITMDVASGRAGKDEVARALRALAGPGPRGSVGAFAPRLSW